ncbi:hypothetical protein TrST_g8442 [Triparma strigata]|uniref:Uncharacterized protein n=1 Tax=Triparma strigata TaxID=1606541 RepID=A0A9W7A4C1_9STRA|nr:hypothetical protein TrST_g8442 [Triparma strigata]
MSLGNWVGLARNGLCCIKDLFPGLGGWLFTPVVDSLLIRYLTLLPPFPMLSQLLPSDLLAASSLTTWLELMICPLQFFAMFNLTKSGISGIQDAVANLSSVPHWEASLETAKRSIHSDDSTVSSNSSRRSGRSRTPSKKLKERGYTIAGIAPTSPEVILATTSFLSDSLKSYKQAQLTSLIESFACLIIGPAFFWLACNSLHVTSTPYIGGVDGVIIALCFMEAALFPCLYFMLVSAVKATSMASKMTEYAEYGYDGDLAFDAKKPDKELFDWVSGAVVLRSSNGFMADSDDTPKKKDRDAEWNFFYNLSKAQGFGSDSEKDLTTLYPWHAPNSDNYDDLTKEAFNIFISGIEAFSDGSTALITDALPLIQGGGERLAVEKYRLWAYFFLNFTAFYGYLMAPVTYYTPNGHNAISDALKFGMSDDAADWAGNFAGDLCWTIEPALILFGAALITWWLGAKVESSDSKPEEPAAVNAAETEEPVEEAPKAKVETPKTKRGRPPKKAAAATPSRSLSRGRSKSPAKAAAATPRQSTRKSTRKQKKA